MICTFPSLKIDIENYQGVKKHLLSFKKEKLEQTGKTHTINGENIKSRKKTNNKWFETQDSINYWNDFNELKLVWTPVNSEYRFSIISNDYVINNSLFMIVGGNLELLCCLFNSNLFKYYTKLVISSGKYNYGSSYIFSNIKINLDFNDIELDNIHKLYEKITHSHNLEYINELDDIIYKHYKITLNEMKFIQSEI